MSLLVARSLTLSARNPRRARALAHAGLPLRVAILAAALLLVACDTGDGTEDGVEAASGGSAREAVAELVEAFQPLPATATSDVQDRSIARRFELLDELREAGPAVGREALTAYQASAGAPDSVRAALLDVAASNLPEATADLLERMATTYDAAMGLGMRTHAIEVLARTSPARAHALLEPLLRAPDPSATLPPKEALVQAYAAAAKASGADAGRALADVATDLRQPPDARYAAVVALADVGGVRARKALEELLAEPASDGILRRKAAQGLQALLPPEELCPILERATQHEHDLVFLRFIGDMMAKSCP